MSGIVSICVGIWNYSRGRSLSPITWTWLGLFFLFVSTFQAWCDENLDKDRAQQTSRCLRRELDLLRDRSAKKQKLDSYFVQSTSIIYANLPKNISSEDFNKYVADFNKWTSETDKWVRENLGAGAAARFDDIGPGTAMNWDRAINKTHNEIINLMAIYRQNLSRLIESPDWEIEGHLENCNTISANSEIVDQLILG